MDEVLEKANDMSNKMVSHIYEKTYIDYCLNDLLIQRKDFESIFIVETQNQLSNLLNIK